ncbi:MAG: hypothetical protein ABI383_11725 [Acidobacteriaceae bacterium]
MSETMDQIEFQLRALQDRILTLNSSYMEEPDDSRRNAVQRELNALEIAVAHYEALKVSGSQDAK